MGSFQFLKQSLAARLSLGVIVCMVVLFMTALGVLFYYSRQAVKEEAIEKATQTLESLFGYLYLQGRQERISELFGKMMEGNDAA